MCRPVDAAGGNFHILHCFAAFPDFIHKYLSDRTQFRLTALTTGISPASPVKGAAASSSAVGLTLPSLPPDDCASFWSDFREVLVDKCGVSADQFNDILALLAGLLWLGEASFENIPDGRGSKCSNPAVVTRASELLKVDGDRLVDMLTCSILTPASRTALRKQLDKEQVLHRSVYLRYYVLTFDRIPGLSSP